MLQRCLTRRVRRKHGQKTWSPNATTSGAAPATGLTMQEALQVAYRPMPPSQTVEYEEDFGRNLLIHREFISRKYRQQLSFDMASMAYSEVELRRGQQRLADAMNRERRGVIVGSGGTENDRVVFDADLGGDDQAGSVESARYLFNEKRMKYCDNFQEQLRRTVKALNGLDSAKDDSGDSQVLFSLMEACAIIYGCDTHAAREAYFHMFYRLDLDTLEEDMEALEQRVEDAAAVRDDLASLRPSAQSLRRPQRHLRDGQDAGGSLDCETTAGLVSRNDRSSTSRTTAPVGGPVQRLIDAMPSLFDDTDGDVNECTVVTSPPSSPRPATEETGSTKAGDDTELKPAPEVPEAFAPLYRAYLAHARGEGALPSHDTSSLVATRDLSERRRWRDLMERLIREDFSSLTREDLRDAAKLNEQLHTLKFMDLKVGDTVKEIVALLQRETGDGSSVDRDTPLQRSPTNPERRV